MKLLSLNSCGLGNLGGIWSLHELLKREDLDSIFLQKIKVLVSYFSSRKFGLGYRNGLVVDCDGKRGGLVLQ